ncbi:MAG: hypothetical protein R2706_14535 [Acidimicrobiales bacterium]
MTDAYVAPFAFTGVDLAVRFELQNDRNDLIKRPRLRPETA